MRRKELHRGLTKVFLLPSVERAREPRGECGVQFAMLSYLQTCKLHACRRVGSSRMLTAILHIPQCYKTEMDHF